jgi:hypothetical protein
MIVGYRKYGVGVVSNSTTSILNFTKICKPVETLKGESTDITVASQAYSVFIKRRAGSVLTTEARDLMGNNSVAAIPAFKFT